MPGTAGHQLTVAFINLARDVQQKEEENNVYLLSL